MLDKEETTSSGHFAQLVLDVNQMYQNPDEAYFDVTVCSFWACGPSLIIECPCTCYWVKHGTQVFVLLWEILQVGGGGVLISLKKVIV